MKKAIILFVLVLMFSFAFADRSIAGSYITVEPSLYISGSTSDWTVGVYNGSSDAEWLAGVTIQFPTSVTVNYSTDFLGDHDPLATDGSTGDGTTITWSDADGGYGNVWSDSWAYATVNVTVDASFVGGLGLNYTIDGDVWGADPHSISDVLTIDPALDDDLVAVAVSGNPTPSAESPASYGINIYNQGQNAAADFDVTLYEGEGNMVGTVTVTELAAGATESYEIQWTPAVAGMTYLYGVVDYAADGNAENNQTPDFSVNVQADDVFIVTVGENTGFQQNYMPANFNWKNSLSEMWFYPDEFCYFGAIYELSYFNNFTTDLSAGTPFKIWMGETTQADGEAGWIPSTDLTLVYDGDVSLPAGANDILIGLDTPFVYTGAGNLVVYVNRPMDTQYWSLSDNWQITLDDSHPNRTRYMYSDSDEFNPANPDAATATVYVNNEHANIRFYFTYYEHGTLEGYVYEDDARDVIVGAEVTVTIDGMEFTQITDATGYYYFPFLFVGDHTVTISAYGYYTLTDDISIVQDELLVNDIYLVQLPNVNVSGHVITSDTGADIEDAEVMLEGFENYTAVTDTDGMFSIPGVYSDQTYTLTITYHGYETNINETVDVGVTDLNLGDIIVEEIAYPAANVIVEENHDGDALIVWNAPDEGLVNTRVLESYTIDRLISGNEDDPTAWVEITTGVIDTSYVDTTWPYVDPGVYRYAVTAIYSSGIASDPAFSNFGGGPPVIPLTFVVSTNSGNSPEGALVTLTNQDGDSEHVYTAIIPESGYATLMLDWLGIYDLTVSLEGFETFEQIGVNVFDVMTIPVELEETIAGISTVTGVNNAPGEVYLSWTPTYAGNVLLIDDDGSADLDFTDTTPYYTTIFDEMGIDYTVYEILVSGDDGPDATTMENYDVVIWETGEQWTDGNTINSNDENNLGTYVDGGGKIIISSPDYLYDAYFGSYYFSAGQFPYDYLGIRSANQDAIILFSDSRICYGHGYADGIYVRITNIFWGRNGIYVDIFTPNNLGTNYCSINNYSVGVQTANSVFTTADLAGLVDGIDTVIEWMTSTINNLLAARNRDFLGYIVTRDDVEIATGVMDREYTDSGLAAGNYEYTVTGVYSSGNTNTISTTVEVTFGDDAEDFVPVVTELRRNYPNPFNPTTKISFSVVEADDVTINIYNLKGEKVKTLIDGYMNVDFHSVDWNGTDDNNTTVASGVYFYKMKAGRYTSTKKMILMK